MIIPMIIKVHLSEELPGLMVQNTAKLGLDPATSGVAVMVINENFGDFTVNASGVWFSVQFSEDAPSLRERKRIRDNFDAILKKWFADRYLALDDYTIDLFWGPTNGRGIVNGEEIVW